MTDESVSNPSSDDQPHNSAEAFVRLFAQHRDRIFAYIVTLVQRVDEAEEVFQQTSLVLWRRFGDFKPESNFVAWACGVAMNSVRNHRRTRQRDRHVFSDELLDAIAADQAGQSVELDARWSALSRCLGKLRSQDRELIGRFYTDEMTAGDIARQAERSVPAIRKAIHRIRTALFHCIDAEMSEATGP